MPAPVFVYEVADIVPCGNGVGSESGAGIFQKAFKFYLAVAHDIRVWSAPFFVFAEKMREHIVPIFFCKVHGVERNAKLKAHAFGVFVVLSGCAYAIVFVVPVIHKYSGEFIPLFL